MLCVIVSRQRIAARALREEVAWIMDGKLAEGTISLVSLTFGACVIANLFNHSCVGALPECNMSA